MDLRFLAVAGCCVLLTGPAFALTDTETGFGIDPPAPFTVEVSASLAEDRAFSIRSSTGQPPAAGTGALCRAGFKAVPAATGVDQAALNARVDTPEVRADMLKPLKPRYIIEREEIIIIKGVRGVAYTAIPRAGPNAADVRVLLSFLETPKGRISLTCATPAASLEAALPAFEAIRASLILP